MPAPASPAQVHANQANAQRSTGPRSLEGKARSAQNAATHGLTAAHVVVAHAEREIYQTFIAQLMSEIQPQGALESIIFEQFARAAWNLRRIAQLEAALSHQAGEDPLLSDDPILLAKFQRLLRYRASTQSQFNRAYREIKSLQQNRIIRTENTAVFSESFPILANPAAYLRAMTKQTESDPQPHPKFTQSVDATHGPPRPVG